MTTDSLLSASHLDYHLSGRKILDIEDLVIKRGKIVGLMGPNGSGKSTLLKLITGEYPSKGHISLHSKPLPQWSRRELARHMAVLPQASTLSFAFSAREVVAMGLIPLSVSVSQGRKLIQETMARCDCLSFADRPYPVLSGGERQRVHLARVLVQLSQASQSPLLLLDEPTSAQDIAQQHMVMALLKRLCHQQDYSSFVIVHDLNHALSYCDEVVVLNQGKVVALGSSCEVLRASTVEQVWGYRPEQIDMHRGGHMLY